MSCRAVWTVIGVPSASSTAAYLVKTAMPGPMIACDRSTGATGERSSPVPLVISSRASGSTAFSSRRNSRREIVAASVDAWAADEDDAGGEGIRYLSAHAIARVRFASAMCQ